MMTVKLASLQGCDAQSSFQYEGISPKGTFPSGGIETFDASPPILPWIGPLQNSFCNEF